MSQFSDLINTLDYQVQRKEQIINQIEVKKAELEKLNLQYSDMIEALSLLATVSEDATNAVLNFITGVVNKALAEIFPYSTRVIHLEKSLHAGMYPHINLIMEVEDGVTRNLVLQNGTGLRQIISFLFTVTLIEVRKGRRLLVMDELLTGLHSKAKGIITDIMSIFANDGFQFVMVEHGVDNIGKIYLIEKPTDVATATPLDGNYNDEVFIFNKPEGYTDSKIYSESGEIETDLSGM